MHESAASNAEYLVRAVPVNLDDGERAISCFSIVFIKHLNPVDRLTLIQNIRNDVDYVKIYIFLSILGKIILLSKNLAPKCDNISWIINPRGIEKSKVSGIGRGKYFDQKKEIFQDGQVIMNTLLSKARQRITRKV